MVQKTNQTPQNNYGRVYLPIITNTKLSVTARVIYALLSAKQGNSNEAHLTQKQIADSLSKKPRAIRDAISALKEAGIVERTKNGWKVIQPNINNRYGYVEQIVLGIKELSNHAKLLYTYYCIVTAAVEKCTRSADTITHELRIHKGNYQKAKEELEGNTLISTIKRNTTHGYLNAVSPRKLKKANPKDFLPESWFKEEKEQVDNIEVNFYEVVAKIKADSNREKLTSIEAVSEPHDRQLENHLTGIKGTTNINQDKIHNTQPDLVDNTAVPEVHVIETPTDLHDYTFKPELVNVKDMDRIFLINIFYIVFRDYAKKPDWRMTNLDFERIESCMLDLDLYDAERVGNYLNFLKTEIIPNRPKANSFAYYVSEGIKDAFSAYERAMEFGSEFSLDDKTMRNNYVGAY